MKPSKAQMVLAESRGVYIPEGYTYVRKSVWGKLKKSPRKEPKPAAKQIVSNFISASLSATAKSNNIMLGQKVPKIIKDSKKAAINITKAENSGLASTQISNCS